MSLLITVLLLILIGAVAGFLGGLFGVGGGVLTVPLLLTVFHRIHFPSHDIMSFVVATSLSVMIINALFAVHSHRKQEKIRLDLVLNLFPGMVVGVIVGSLFSQQIPSHWLHIFFGLLLVVIGVRMVLLIKPKPDRKLPQWPFLSLFSTFVGVTSGLLGLGGGTLLVPFLVNRNVPMRQTTAYASVSTLIISIVGTVSYLLLAESKHIHLPYCVGYIYLPAFFSIASVSSFFTLLGVKSAYGLPPRRLSRIFGIFLLVIALHLLSGGQ